MPLTSVVDVKTTQAPETSTMDATTTTAEIPEAVVNEIQEAGEAGEDLTLEILNRKLSIKTLVCVRSSLTWEILYE